MTWSAVVLILLSIIAGFHATTSRNKECLGTTSYLNIENINDFDQCNHVRGNLILNQNSVNNSSLSLTYEDLFMLKNVREIDGYLLIERLNHSHISNLRFLRNLQNIHGQETVRLFGVHDYTLLIQNNPHLVTLNLASLKSIENGGLRIVDNPQLCLVDSISFESHIENYSFGRIGGYSSDCSGVTCHGQCVEEHGCWGTSPDECISCRSYTFIETCVDACNLSISTPQHDRQKCVPITPEDLFTMSTFTSSKSTGTLEYHDSSTETETNSITSSVTTVAIKIKIADKLLPSLVPTGVFIMGLVIIVVPIALVTYCQKRKKCKAISLTKPKKHSNITGTPEKYSRSSNDKMVLVAACDEGDTSSSSTRRSANVSISSLASASIHSEDRKDNLTQTAERPSVSVNAAPASMTLTRRNSPMDHTHGNASSSASYYTSSGDTGYGSGATSRKPSLVGSRASSTSLRQPLALGGATGNVYSTGQHQLHPHRQLYHQHMGHHQRSRSSVTSYQTNPGLANGSTKPANNDLVNISSLANNSGLFETH